MDHPVRVRKSATYEDLAALPPGVKGEILDGVLYTQPRPRAHHSRIEGMVYGDVWSHFDRKRRGSDGWWIIVEPGIELPRAREFSPDVAGWRKSNLPTLPGPGEPFRTVPDWICEVLSPSNRNYDTRTKRRFYAEIGVPYLWYIDPEARTLVVSRLYEGRWLELGAFGDDELVRAEPFEELEIDLNAWWP